MHEYASAGVAVIGSITTDVTSFSARLPKPGETLLGDTATLVLGGKGANQAIAAARAGASVWMIGCVGTDEFQNLTLNGLAQSGVNTDYVHIVEGPTGIAHIRVNTQTGQNDIVMIPLANSHLSAQYAEESLRALKGHVKAVMLQLETPANTTIAAAKIAKELDMTVILDPAPAQDLPDEIWQYLDFITPNETEAELLTGITVTDNNSACQAAQVLLQRGVRTVIITRAEHGSLIATTAGHWISEPFPVTAIDTTAAGDAFTGVLAQSLAAGTDFPTAIRRASAAGAVAVTVRGASTSLPCAEAIDSFINARTAQSPHNNPTNDCPC